MESVPAVLTHLTYSSAIKYLLLLVGVCAAGLALLGLLGVTFDSQPTDKGRGHGRFIALCAAAAIVAFAIAAAIP